MPEFTHSELETMDMKSLQDIKAKKLDEMHDAYRPRQELIGQILWFQDEIEKLSI